MRETRRPLLIPARSSSDFCPRHTRPQVVVVERSIGDDPSDCNDAPADNTRQPIRRYFLTTGNGRRGLARRALSLARLRLCTGQAHGHGFLGQLAVVSPLHTW